MAFKTEVVVGIMRPIDQAEETDPRPLTPKGALEPRRLHVYRDREKLPIRTRLLFTFAAVAVLHVAALVLLLAGSATAGQPLAAGLVITAYLAGIKHSYDWDHLAAIDNSTRKFVAQHKDPVSVGFAFSLGHSSVVTLAGLLLVAGATSIGLFMEHGTAENRMLGLIGGGISGLFLLAMGLFNGSAFVRATRAYRNVRSGGELRDGDLEAKGLVARLLAKPLSKLERPRNIYVIGFLFGLGFDTATTVGLLVITMTASIAGVSPLALMSLPLAFTAAMTLCDSTNGVVMMKMYKSAIRNPRRKLGFNVVITGISALSALFISLITLTGFITAAFDLHDSFTTWLSGIELGDTGLILVGLLILVWFVSVLRAAPRLQLQSRRARPEFDALPRAFFEKEFRPKVRN